MSEATAMKEESFAKKSIMSAISVSIMEGNMGIVWLYDLIVY
jgi:hypothetical protein